MNSPSEPAPVFTVGFLVNPIAGMGGRVGLKGTDDVVEEALALGAQADAPRKALQALEAVKGHPDLRNGAVTLRWLTCAAPMGEDALRRAGFTDISIVHRPQGRTNRADTVRAVRAFVDGGAGLVVFCGGDGTARDIASTLDMSVPVLGIPAGVKMYSGVFCVSPARTAEVLLGYALGRIGTAEVGILDLDEERYRRDEWAVRLYTTVRTPFEPTLVQAAKMLIAETGEEDAQADLAGYVAALIEAEPDTLFLLGPGGTVRAVADRLGAQKTLLGIDAWLGGRLVGRDINEHDITGILERSPRCKLVLSPIGAQGFVLGRGNLQLSPAIVKAIGRDNLLVVATPGKLARTPVLRVDTGDPALDAEIVGNGHMPVIVGHRRRRLVRIEA